MYFVGVDPHKQTHTAALVDPVGRLVATQAFPHALAGYQAMRAWVLAQLPAGGEVRYVVENPRSYGWALCQYLLAEGEVVRALAPHQTARERRHATAAGKDDPKDATAIARAGLREGDRLPLVPPAGPIAELKVWLERVEDLVAQATRLTNQLHAHLLALDPGYAAHGDLGAQKVLAYWRGRARRQAPRCQGEAAARWRVVAALVADLAHMRAQRQEATRGLKATLAQLDARPLLALPGVAHQLAAKLLVETGHPALFADEAAWAMFAGVAPVPCSSGRRVQFRLNRGGNRQLNCALTQILHTRMAQSDPATRAYLDRKLAAGKTDRGAKRCAKRLIAREVFRALQQVQGLGPIHPRAGGEGAPPLIAS